MKIIEIKKTISSNSFKLEKDNLYIFNDMQVYFFEEMLNKNKIQHAAKILHIDYLKRWSGDQSKNVVIIRSGGIGDIIALSSLISFIEKKVTFITQKKYAPIFKWFSKDVHIIDFLEQFAKKTMYFNLKKPEQINFEGIIENSKDNWYHLFFEGLKNIDFEHFGRPQLKNISIKNKEIDILLTLKASSKIRTIPLQPIYEALIENGINPNRLYIHKANISLEDARFLQNNPINIIEATDLNDFLNDVAIAKNVISTDTAALHFREGLQLPAIGLYNAFPSECRTKYYKYTQSYDLTSNCRYQPCFLHTRKEDEICENFICLNDIKPQLKNILCKI